VPALQIRNLPQDLHDAVAVRARREGVSMAKWVTDVIRSEVFRMSVHDWVADAGRDTDDLDLDHVDITGVLDKVREEYDPVV